jgi:hypothetical protein
MKLKGITKILTSLVLHLFTYSISFDGSYVTFIMNLITKLVSWWEFILFLIVVAAILVLEGDDIDRRYLETFNKTILTFIRGIHNRRGAFPGKNEVFLNKFEELISHIEQITGAEANDGEPACVIVKFICRTNEHIKKLLEYFDSDDLKYRLKEIANLISGSTKTQVNLSFRISKESLDSILQGKGIVINYFLTLNMICIFFCKKVFKLWLNVTHFSFSILLLIYQTRLLNMCVFISGDILYCLPKSLRIIIIYPLLLCFLYTIL